jgi:phenylalanyl-tRNA synthetase alpha subunit
MNVIGHPARREQDAFFLTQNAADVRIKAILPFRLNERCPVLR